MTQPISLVIITLNEERYLGRLLASVGPVVAESIVLDSGSTDQTVTIAAAAKAQVTYKKFEGFGTQKQAAVTLASQPWILSLDADELPDPEALNGILALDLSKIDPKQSFSFRRLNRIGGIEVRHGSWNPDLVCRLFHRDHHAFDAALVHERVRPGTPTTVLPGLLLHDTYQDYRGLFGTRYHLLKAQRLRAEKRHASGPLLAIRAIWGFTRSYLWKGGFRDGRAGVMLALAEAVNSSLGLALASETAWPLPDHEAPAPRSSSASSS